jgi:hypothetical protein
VLPGGMRADLTGHHTDELAHAHYSDFGPGFTAAALQGFTHHRILGPVAST